MKTTPQKARQDKSSKTLLIVLGKNLSTKRPGAVCQRGSKGLI